MKRKKRDPREKLRTMLGDYQLRSFPALIMKALELVRNNDISLTEVADPISADPGLSVSLLRTVNSAALAVRHEVKSVHHAIHLLGRCKLESLLISFAVQKSLPRPTRDAFDAREFWTTAVHKAITARSLADRIDPSGSSDSYTAALLQDMAVPILHDHLGERYEAPIMEWRNGDDDLAMVEHRTFGWDHAEVGSWMCGEWKLPEQLSRAIANHHARGDNAGTELPAVNLVASFKEGDINFGLSRLVESARDLYGIPEAETESLIETSFQEARGMAHLFG